MEEFIKKLASWITEDPDVPQKCPRCGAKYKDDPSCGKTIHNSLPERPKKDHVDKIAEDIDGDDPLNIRARAGRFQGKPHYAGPDSNIEREVIEGAEQVFWAGTATGGEWIVMDGGGRDHYVEPDSDAKTLTVTKTDGTPLITYKVNVSVIPVDEGPEEGPVEEGY